MWYLFWLEFRDTSYIYEVRMWKFIWLKNVKNNVLRGNAIFIYPMKFLYFCTLFGGTSQIENKIGKKICVWGVKKYKYVYCSVIGYV